MWHCSDTTKEMHWNYRNSKYGQTVRVGRHSALQKGEKPRIPKGMFPTELPKAIWQQSSLGNMQNNDTVESHGKVLFFSPVPSRHLLKNKRGGKESVFEKQAKKPQRLVTTRDAHIELSTPTNAFKYHFTSWFYLVILPRNRAQWLRTSAHKGRDCFATNNKSQWWEQH